MGRRSSLLHLASQLAIVFTIPNSAVAVIETAVSFKQINFNAAPYLDVVDAAPVPGAFVSADFDDNSYDIQASVDVSTPYTLRTKTSLSVTASPVDIQNWKSMEANARATSTLADTAFVQGVPDGASGVVELHWAVSGNTSLALKNAAEIGINSIVAVTTLESTIPSAGGLLLDELHSPPAGVDNYDMTFPAATDRLMFPVAWTAGEGVPIFFDLTSRLELSVTNELRHFREFEADLSADFGNSAVLEGVVILDQAGNPLEGASLAAADGSIYPSLINAVPEPSSLVICLLLLPVFAWLRTAA